MQNKKPKKPIPRVLSSDLYPVVGETAEKLKAVIPVFGEELVKALLSAIGTKQITKGALKLINEEPKQKVEVTFEKGKGGKTVEIALSGSWKKLSDLPLGNPLFAPVRGIIYRKRQPSDSEPIIKENERIEPGGPLCVISQTKNNTWYLYLPTEQFPKGGILSKFEVADGHEVEKGGIICYVQKIE